MSNIISPPPATFIQTGTTNTVVVDAPSFQTSEPVQQNILIDLPNDYQNNNFVIDDNPFEIPENTYIDNCSIDENNINDCHIIEENCNTNSNNLDINSKIDLILQNLEKIDIKPIEEKSNVPKYHIMDMFWMFNPKYSNVINGKDKFNDNESHFVNISYNMDFGNLRISFYQVPNGAIHNSTVFLQKLIRLTAGTIYPSSCFNISNNSKTSEFSCIEQLVSNTNQQWEKERPIVHINKYHDEKNINLLGIRMTIFDIITNKTFYYDFYDSQLEMLKHACNFAYNDGFKLLGTNIINKG